jgi:hypothetical protein
MTAFCAVGCHKSDPTAIREAIKSLDKHAVMLDRAAYRGAAIPEEDDGRKKLSAFDPEAVIAVASQLYSESDDPATRAKAVSAAFLAGSRSSDSVDKLLQRRLDLINRALTDPDAKTVVVALEAYSELLKGAGEDAAPVAELLRTTRDKAVAETCIGILVRWQIYEPVFDQVYAAASEEGETPAYRLWLAKVAAALMDLQNLAMNSDGQIPEKLVDRVVEILSRHPDLIPEGGQFLLAPLDGRNLAKIRSLFESATDDATKAQFGALVLALDPNDAKVRPEMERLQQALIAHLVALPEFQSWSLLNSYHGWICRSAMGPQGVERLTQLWRIEKKLPITVRQSLIEDVFGHSRSTWVPFVQAFSDDELRDMIKLSAAARWLVSEELSQDNKQEKNDPETKAAKERLRKILKETE